MISGNKNPFGSTNLREACIKIWDNVYGWLEKKPERSDTWREHCDQVYVRPEATIFGQDDQRFDLMGQLDSFIQTPKLRVAVILGDAGTGKSTLAKKWLREQLPLDKEKISLDTPLPLFISLNKALRHSEIRYDKLLKDYLRKEIGLDKSEIRLLKEKQRLIVFCDGYDEINRQKISFPDNLYNDNKWATWKKAQFVITSRPEKFGKSLEKSALLNELLTAFSPENVSVASKPLLVLYQLSPFSEENIQEYVNQWNKNFPSAIDYTGELKSIPGLQALAANPIILSIILDCLPKLARDAGKEKIESEHLKRIHIYTSFVEQWFMKQVPRVWNVLEQRAPELVKKISNKVDKLKKEITLTTGHAQKDLSFRDVLNVVLKEALNEYAVNLAYFCLQNNEGGSLQLAMLKEETEKRCLLSEKITRHLQLELTDEESTSLLIALRSGCLLRCDNRYFQFLHPSLLEYFAQSHIFKGMVGRINLAILPDKEFLNINLTAQPESFRFLAERVPDDNELKAALWATVIQSIECPDVAIAAANAITILNDAKQPLNHRSLKGIRIPGADLSGANLQGADLRQADLSRVKFIGTYLADADLREANVTGCEWSKPQFIPFNNVISTVYTWDNQWCIAGNNAGTIVWFNRQSGVIEKKVTQRPWYVDDRDRDYAVKDLAVDGGLKKRSTRYLASASHSGDIFLWDSPLGKSRGVLSGHTGPVNCIAYSTEGELLASGGVDRTIRLWNPIKRLALKVISREPYPVITLKFAPDKHELASISRGESFSPTGKSIRLWNLDKNTSQVLCGYYRNKVSCLSYAHERHLLASVGDGSRIYIWNLDKNISSARKYRHNKEIIGLSFAPGGEAIAFKDVSNDIYLLNQNTLRKISEPVSIKYKFSSLFAKHDISFDPNGNELASVGSFNGVHLWHLDQKPSQAFPVDSCFRGLQLQDTRGLNDNQQRFFAYRDALGRPKRMIYPAIDPAELLKEFDASHSLINLCSNLKKTRHSTPHAPSLFDPEVQAGLHSWLIYICRPTIISKDNHYGIRCDADRHAYGIAEGLDQLGRRVLVRFDLVIDSQGSEYARVKTQVEIAADHQTAAGQQSFMKLFWDNGAGKDEFIFCLLGMLALKDAIILFEKIIGEQSRQFMAKADNNKRITYTLFGGKKGDEDKHNCLTWLRYVLDSFPTLAKIPSDKLDFIIANPEWDLSMKHWDANNKMHFVDVRTWANFAASNSSNQFRGT